MYKHCTYVSIGAILFLLYYFLLDVANETLDGLYGLHSGPKQELTIIDISEVKYTPNYL